MSCQAGRLQSNLSFLPAILTSGFPHSLLVGAPVHQLNTGAAATTARLRAQAQLHQHTWGTAGPAKEGRSSKAQRGWCYLHSQLCLCSQKYLTFQLYLKREKPESEASQFACCYNEMAGLRKLNSIRDRFFYPYGCLILPLGPDPEFTCKAPTGYSELIES